MQIASGTEYSSVLQLYCVRIFGFWFQAAQVVTLEILNFAQIIAELKVFFSSFKSISLW